MGNRARLPELPDAMAGRVEWSRKTAREHPEQVKVDHEYLPWVFCEEDGYWYSFDGNYSEVSPDEKVKQAAALKRKQEERLKEHEINIYKRLLANEYWSQIRDHVLKRDKYICQVCGKIGDENLHIHHVLKKANGGTDHYDNLLTVCPPCHKKADTILYNPEWKQQLR